MRKAAQNIVPTIPLERKTSIPISGISLTLPCFFPSISCVKANLKTIEYLRILKAVGHPQFLISAYDMHNCSKREVVSINNILKESVKDGTAIILDSGNYESYWVRDTTWNRAKYWSCLSSCDYGLAFHFDKRLQMMRSGTSVSITNDVERSVLKDQKKARKGTIVPIIHAPTDLLAEISVSVAKRLNPVMIAVPERELGDGIIARAVTVARIREALNTAGQYYPIHLLGTGNLLSILVYVMSGADSFDGLEWCQTTVNYENALLYHFQQREFFGHQSEYDSLNIPYIQATLAHNLGFYRIWMQKIQESLVSESIADLAENYMRKEFLGTLKEELAKV